MALFGEAVIWDVGRLQMEGEVMIRLMRKDDLDNVGEIVNRNWKDTYCAYVNPQLLSDEGCENRKREIKKELVSGNLANYVYEDGGTVKALLTIGKTADEDKPDAFEIWRIYVSQDVQGRGIGKYLLEFAEGQAAAYGFREIVIWAFKGNEKAVSFYKHYGYTEDKVIDLGEPYGAGGVRFHKVISR